MYLSVSTYSSGKNLAMGFAGYTVRVFLRQRSQIVATSLLLLLYPYIFLLQQIIRHFFSATNRLSTNDVSIIWTAAVFGSAFYIYGRHNISGTGISARYAVYLMILLVAATKYIIDCKNNSTLLIFNRITFLLISCSFVYTALILPSSLHERKLIFISAFVSGNSTNFINVMILSCVYMLLADRSSLPYSVCVLYLLSFFWENRTGFILGSFVGIAYILSSEKKPGYYAYCLPFRYWH
jgi:hypothetical protein